MSHLEVRRYRPEMANAWNALNRAAVNGHFLFDRGFMDYHADRFTDASLVVLDDDAPIALLPANLSGSQAWSHQGLTFGGLVHPGIGTSRVMAALDLCAAELKAMGAAALTYKAMPWIYPSAPAQEDLYWLFRHDAELVRRDAGAAIDYRARGRVSTRRERGAKKAAKAGLAFARTTNWAGFWPVLEGVLHGRHGASPTHTLAEIEMLAARFPEEIALYVAGDPSAPLAGVAMFRAAHVAHAQYIAAGEAGREAGALDGLFEHLVAEHAGRFRFFDFGHSTTEQGRVLNEGLIRQKEEFGAGHVVHDVWQVSL